MVLIFGLSLPVYAAQPDYEFDEDNGILVIGKAIVVPVVVRFKLFRKIFERVKFVRSIETLVILAMAAFYFSVVPWCERTNQLVTNAMFFEHTLKHS